MLWFFPLYGSFTGAASIAALMMVIYYKRKQILRRLTPHVHVEMKKFLNNLDLEQEIEPLMDAKLKDLVETVKAQIPMASMFLSGSLSNNLKSMAKKEMMLMIPELKTRMGGVIESELKLDEQLEQSSIPFPCAYKLILIGAIVGCVLGFIPFFLL